MPTEQLKQLRRRLDFRSLPKGWQLERVTVDWTGEPLVLFAEGRPPRPPHSAPVIDIANWMSLPPTAHHLIHWKSDTSSHVRFENPEGFRYTHDVQPLGEGWLLAATRGGTARVFDKTGKQVLRTLQPGDGIEQVQTTAAGDVWVGYFDEGVFGNGPGAAGLACFDPQGAAVFRFSDFAAEQGLPHIDDCYALNVWNDYVWVCYYSAFPLVCLKNNQLVAVWNRFGPATALAVRGEQYICLPDHHKPYLLVRTLGSPEAEVWRLADPDGKLLSEMKDPADGGASDRVPFSVAMRGPRIYVYNQDALMELP